MPIDWSEPGNPDMGVFQLHCERPFHALNPDPDKILLAWLAPTVSCPICAASTGLTLAWRQGHDPAVQARCPVGHEWPELLIDVAYFRTYTKLRYGLDCDPGDLWITDAGFGEEPPPPDTLQDYADAAAHIAKTVRREIRTKVRRETRGAKKSLRQLIRISRGGDQAKQPQPTARARPAAPAEPPKLKTPSYTAYRKALGIPAPQRGPHCLVCSDTRRITAPGVNIPCTECS